MCGRRRNHHRLVASVCSVQTQVGLINHVSLVNVAYSLRRRLTTELNCLDSLLLKELSERSGEAAGARLSKVAAGVTRLYASAADKPSSRRHTMRSPSQACMLPLSVPRKIRVATPSSNGATSSASCVADRRLLIHLCWDPRLCDLQTRMPHPRPGRTGKSALPRCRHLRGDLLGKTQPEVYQPVVPWNASALARAAKMPIATDIKER